MDCWVVFIVAVLVSEIDTLVDGFMSLILDVAKMEEKSYLVKGCPKLAVNFYYLVLVL